MKITMRKFNYPVPAQGSRGFTIIEVAIAMLVLSVGLLGVAGLQASGMKNTHQSHQRAIAMTQARDLADRMRANLTGTRTFEYTKTISLVPTTPDCESSANSCTPAELAASDLYNWQNMTATLLPSATGSVACTDIDAGTATVLESGSDCLITMRWDGNREGATGVGCDPNNTADLTCLRLRFVP